jgi:hypothetical protein
VGGWDSLREVDFTGSASRTLTVNNAPNTGFVDNAGSGTPLVFGLVDFDGTAGVAINGSTMAAPPTCSTWRSAIPASALR